MCLDLVAAQDGHDGEDEEDEEVGDDGPPHVPGGPRKVVSAD